MSRLSRLRSFWRSQRRAPIRDGIYRPHAAVNLLPAEYRDGGGLRPDGSWVLSASTGTKERGTRTPETATTGGCSLLSERGAASGAWVHRIALPHESSFTDRGSSGAFTVGGATGLTLREPAT